MSFDNDPEVNRLLANFVDKEETERKCCARCGYRKLLKEFAKNSKNSDGKQSWCRLCAKDYAASRHRDTISSKKRLGICTRSGCYEKLTYKTASLCIKHWGEKSSWTVFGDTKSFQIFLDLLDRQGHKCNYCGVGLVIGLNAQIDHILPKINFPGKADDAGNLQILCKYCNMGKHDLVPEEYFKHIERSYDYLRFLGCIEETP